MIDPVEFPVAIEELAVRRLHALLGHGSFLGGEGHFDGVGCHLVFAEDGLVFPVGSSLSESRKSGEKKE